MVLNACKNNTSHVGACTLLIVLGKGMSYMPGASSLAATHRGKVKNIRLSTLRDTQMISDPRSSILQFEKESIAYDSNAKRETHGK